MSSFSIETFPPRIPSGITAEMTVRQQLDDAAIRLDGGLTGEPPQRQLEAAIGDIYYNLGEYDH